MTETIKLVNVSKTYSDIVAVENFNFAAEKGQIIALLGPNGAGKSTLMNMITGFLAPTSGKIFVDGLDISQYPENAKEKIGFLPEGSPIYPDMSVKMFLKYMADIRGVGKDHITKAVHIANIENVLHQKIETLSKGYLRRVGFAQSVISNPNILLLDEPTDGLDPNQKAHMRNLISKMRKNKTIIISTHLLDEAETVCNRIVLINKGKIMADGTTKDILKQTKTKSLEKAFAKLTTGENKGE
ncbi:MAG: ABC transporter ATP-binding protein [Alphaproteobacteria bacterium]|nr:ABC transporter ATP-binding protein [Alphaproteobacteria bacterium]